MATKQTKQLKFTKPRAAKQSNVDPQVRERLRGVAAELRQMMHGKEGCPEWGAIFRES